MPKKCLVCGIYSSKNDPDRSYHRWPSSFDNQKLWMQRLGMIETNYIGKYQFICSNHFSSDDFILKNWGPGFRRYLKTDSTPRSMGQITNSQSPLSSRSSDKILTLSKSEIYQKPVKDGPAERNTTPASTGSEIEQIPFDSPLQLKRKRKIDEEEMESIVQKKLNLDSSAILTCSSSETITVSGASSLTLTASEVINAVSQQAKLEDEQMVDLDKPLSIEPIDKPSKAKNRYVLSAVVNKDVPIIFPYISDTGVWSVERCIFTFMVGIGSLLMFVIMYVRYRQVNEVLDINKEGNFKPNIKTLNTVSYYLSIISALNVFTVGCFQVEPYIFFHLTAAAIAFVTGWMVLIIQTYISFKLYPKLGNRGVNICRAVLSTVIGVALFLTGLFGVVSYMHFKGDHISKWDESSGGYQFHVVSAASEWVLILGVVLYLSLYAGEFKSVVLFKPKIEIIDNV